MPIRDIHACNPELVSPSIISVFWNWTELDKKMQQYSLALSFITQMFWKSTGMVWPKCECCVLLWWLSGRTLILHPESCEIAPWAICSPHFICHVTSADVIDTNDTWQLSQSEAKKLGHGMTTPTSWISKEKRSLKRTKLYPHEFHCLHQMIIWFQYIIIHDLPAIRR